MSADGEGAVAPAFEPLREGYDVAVGSRRDFAVTVRNLVESNRDAVLTQLATDEVARDYADAIRIGIKKRDRTALNLYAQIMKLVGEERRIVVEFVQGLGVRNEGDLKRMVEMARSVEGVGPHDGAERCVAYLEAYFNAFPDQRPAALRRLGGFVPVGG